VVSTEHRLSRAREIATQSETMQQRIDREAVESDMRRWMQESEDVGQATAAMTQPERMTQADDLLRQLSERVAVAPVAVDLWHTATDRQPVTMQEAAPEQAPSWLKANRRRRVFSIAEKVEATLGPNPCTRGVLENQDGDVSVCGAKGCAECGPRRRLQLRLQTLEGFGNAAYITEYTDRDEMQRDKNRVNRSAWRRYASTGNDRDKLTYMIVGDEWRGWIAVTDKPMHPEQRLSDLGQWIDRVIHRYSTSTERLCRSYVLGWLSRLTSYLMPSGDTKQTWRLRIPDYKEIDAVDATIQGISDAFWYREPGGVPV
jgi:hypothetical protein